MIPIGIQILVATYTAARAVEHYGAKKKRQRRLKPQPEYGRVRERGGYPRVTGGGGPSEAEARQLGLSTAAVVLTIARPLYPPVTVIGLIAISVATVPILRAVETSLLRERRIKNDLLNSIASVGCMATGHYLAASLLAWFYHLGSKMVLQIQGDAKKRLTDIFGLQQIPVYVLREGVEVEASIDDLAAGDIVVVNTGETIPVDGEITAGKGAVDQHGLTGEFMPVEKEAGDRVFAATLVVSGRLQVRTEKAGIDTTVAKINTILDNTADFKTSIQVRGEKWANDAAVPLLTLGLVSLPALGFTRIMMLLYSSPSNNIRVLTSLQTLNHLGLVSRNRILVKDGRALEGLKDIDTVLFDKTGTLTTEDPEVGRIVVSQGDAADIVFYAAAAEHRLNHPIAQAILAKARELNLELPEISDANYRMGYGISVTFGDQVIRVGSGRFMQAEGIEVPPAIAQAVEDALDHGYTLVVVAVDERVRGAIEIKPRLRPEMRELVARLHARGVTHCAIVSGDHERPTRDLARRLEMDDYFFDVLPERKAEIVERLRAQGRKVCFVGDGINDAIAMKTADVSVSLSGATSAATDLAQIIFLDGALSKLDDVFEISSTLHRRLHQSVLICMAGSSINVVAVYFFFLGVLPSLLLLSAVVPAVGVAHAMQPVWARPVWARKHRRDRRAGEEIAVTAHDGQDVEPASRLAAA